MIKTSLEFLADQMNLYLKRKDPTNFENIDCVVISALMKPDGTFAVFTDGDNTFRIVITLINLEEDRIAESQNFYKRVNDKIQIVNPPININMYVLISAFANNYPTELRLLSHVISFFQASSVFDSAQFPALNAKTEADKPWQKVGRITATLHATTFEQQNNLWASLGAKYMPSVVYKIRTISFMDIEPKAEGYPVTEVTVNGS